MGRGEGLCRGVADKRKPSTKDAFKNILSLFAKVIFLTILPNPPNPPAMGGGSTQPLKNVTNPYQSKTCLDKATRAFKKFVVGWVGFLIIVSTPGPVLTRNGTWLW